MNVEIIKEDKHEVELKMDNLTVAEILRVYLNDQNIDFAAWRREHPFKPLIMRIESKDKSVKKAVGEAIDSIKKDLDKISSGIKKK
jgi:DNA-directed RNA polymerase subunit L